MPPCPTRWAREVLPSVAARRGPSLRVRGRLPARSASRCRPGRLLWLRFRAPVKGRRRAARLARRQVEALLLRIRCPERLPARTLFEILAAVFRQEKMPQVTAPALSRTAYSDRSRQGEIVETALVTPRRLRFSAGALRELRQRRQPVERPCQPLGRKTHPRPARRPGMRLQVAAPLDASAVQHPLEPVDPARVAPRRCDPPGP